MTVSREQIREALGQMPVLELVALIKELEGEWGVSSAAPVAVVAGSGGGDAPEAEPEKTEFSIVMTSFGDNKVAAIKAVRAVTSMGLKEAKELVESAPTTIKENVGKEEAETIKKQFEDAGATVEFK